MKSLFLKPLYNRSVNGLPLVGTPAESAGRFLNGPGTLEERAKEMTRTYTILCGSTGFVFGLGGFITMPITLPSNIVGVAMLQLHMCAATAFMGGHDLHDDEVRARCIACLTHTADTASEVDERDETVEVIDRSAVKLAERGIRYIAEGAFTIATKATSWTAKKVVTSRLPRRSLPLLGGVLGGASDAYSTGRVAEAARVAFLNENDSAHTVAELSTGDDSA